MLAFMRIDNGFAKKKRRGKDSTPLVFSKITNQVKLILSPSFNVTSAFFQVFVTPAWAVR